MRFWDSSVLVPLLVEEPGRSAPLTRLFADEQPVLAWWGARIECASSVARLERNGELSASAAASALETLEDLAARWQEVLPSETLRGRAIRLLRVHPLRAADAVQLAAALQAAESEPSSLKLVCLDEQLARAGRREGLRVIGAAELAGMAPRARRRTRRK